MTRARRELMVVGLVLLAALVGAVWGVSRMLEGRRAAMLGAEDLERTRELVLRIESLRSEPAIASAEDVGVQELGAHVESAMASAGIGAQRLEGIFPQSSRRVSGLPYELKPTALSLRGVTLGQLMVFLHALSGHPGLNVRDLSLSTPVGGEASGLWDVQATLTYLIFSPEGVER